MAKNKPKQNPTLGKYNTIRFVRVVKKYMFEREWTQKDLAIAAEMSESMISRMFRNTNRRGGPFQLTPEMVMQFAMGLEKGWDGYKELAEAAFPFFAKSSCDKTRASLTDYDD